jgi:nucleoid-associated protein YgaU
VGELSSADATLAVAVGLGGLVLARIGLDALLSRLGRATRRLHMLARRAFRALRPQVARRVLATALGLATPVVALLADRPAAAAPAPDGRPVLAGPSDPAPSATGVQRDDEAPRRDAVHVVRRGESLWSIAREHLGPHARDAQVARAWPRWYAANRGVIGPDPSLIVPGQHLQVPGRRSAGTPTQPHDAPAPGTPVPLAQSLDPDRR